MTDMKRLSLHICILLTLLPSVFAAAGTFRQVRDSVLVRDSILQYTDSFLDSISQNPPVLTLNDYPMIGVVYGVSLNRMSFNPVYKQKMLFIPEYFGVTFTKYQKMFGTLPYFGFQLGLFYGHEGYEFKEDEETGKTATIEGATKAIYNIIEMPFLVHMHYDFDRAKIMANIGIYGGYRTGIERSGPYVDPTLQYSFKETDHRIEYGLQGGVGFGLVFSPIELHFQGMLRYSWSNLYDPDYASKYYYRYAYPFDIMITAGVHFQLGKRTGKTKKVLRQEAYDIVYPKDENR